LRDDIEEIKRGLTDNLERVLSQFWPGWIKRGSAAHPVPGKARGDFGSFVVYLGPYLKYTRGQWFRSSQGIGGDILNLFAYGDNGSHIASAETFRRAREFLGMAEERPETDEEHAKRIQRENEAAKKRRDDERRQAAIEAAKLKTAEDVWKECIPITGTHSERYLLERLGIEPKGGWPDVLRHHHGLPYPPLDGEIDRNLVFQTLVCRVSDVSDEFTAIWRIFLHPTKPEKAPVPNAKLGLGPAGGGAVRIGGSGPVIGVAEGVESALGAWLYIGQKYPVWSALSTSGMAGLQTPMEVEKVNIFPDGDKRFRKARGRSQERYEVAEPAGRVAAKALFESVKPMGIIQPEPKVGQDYCDMWRKKLERITYG